jgi:hypothetical protein
MDFFQWLDTRLGRWLAYADHCLNSDIELQRCQGFWNFVAVVLGVVCVAAVGAAIRKVLLDRKKGPARWSRP